MVGQEGRNTYVLEKNRSKGMDENQIINLLLFFTPSLALMPRECCKMYTKPKSKIQPVIEVIGKIQATLNLLSNA